jgi:hypothetical protein
VLGRQPSTEGEYPACHEARIPSPNHRWTLVSSANPQFCPGGKESKATEFVLRLYLMDERIHRKHLILEYGSSGYVSWATDSTAFFVNQHVASNESDAYFYRADSMKQIDLTKAILRSDRSVAKFRDGHRYVLARKWLSTDAALVQFCGHTDESPVVQFDIRYRVGLDGSVRKLSQRQGPPDSVDCVWDEPDKKTQ